MSRQKLIAIRKDGGTFVLKGDSDASLTENQELGILPRLLDDGWRIETLHMTASAAVNDDQVLGLALLQK